MKEQLISIFAEIFEGIEINEHIARANSSEWDSLAHLRIVSAIESAFELEIEPEEMPGIDSFQSALALIEKKVATRA
jgi:acyl carrier protein